MCFPNEFCIHANSWPCALSALDDEIPVKYWDVCMLLTNLQPLTRYKMGWLDL